MLFIPMEVVSVDLTVSEIQNVVQVHPELSIEIDVDEFHDRGFKWGPNEAHSSLPWRSAALLHIAVTAAGDNIFPIVGA